MAVNIAKSRWYITIRVWPMEHVRQVLARHGGFDTKTEAATVAESLDPSMKAMPTKGEKILKNRKQYFVPQK